MAARNKIKAKTRTKATRPNMPASETELTCRTSGVGGG